jgi:hypothetical protein
MSEKFIYTKNIQQRNILYLGNVIFGINFCKKQNWNSLNNVFDERKFNGKKV